MASSFSPSSLFLRKAGMSPVKASPRSWMRHMRMTLSMSAVGNSSVISMAIRATRQLCSATLSRRPEEVSQCRVRHFSCSATERISSSFFPSMVPLLSHFSWSRLRAKLSKKVSMKYLSSGRS